MVLPITFHYLRRFGQLFISGDITSRFYKHNRMALFPLQDNLLDMQLFPTSVTSKQNIKWLTNCNKWIDNAVTSELVHNPYNQMLAMDCLNKLPEQFLMKADKATMANTIEERLPLLDKEIIQYAFTLPIHLKKNKYVLRKSVEDLLPSEIVWRKKRGFGTPISGWISNTRFKEYILDKMKHSELLKEICNPQSLNKVITKYEVGDYQQYKYSALSFSAMIWSLLALQVWYDIWF